TSLASSALSPPGRIRRRSHRGGDRNTRTSHHGADRRASQRRGEEQAGEKAHRGAAQNVRRGRERLPLEREGPVGASHDDGEILAQEVMPIPAQPDDLVVNLVGPTHVVVPDGPQVAGTRHGRSSVSTGPWER